MILNEKAPFTVATVTEADEEQSRYEDTIFSPKVGLIPNCNKPGEVHLCNKFTVYEGIRNRKWENLVIEGRSKKNNLQDYKLYKSSNVPAFTTHGPCTYASNTGMLEGNGTACIDLDNLSNKEAIKEQLSRDPYALAVYDSFGGEGLVFESKINKVSTPEEFEVQHAGLRRYLKEKYGLTADEGAKSFKCLRLVSSDPDIRINKNSLIWVSKPYLNEERKKAAPQKENNHYTDLLSYVAKLGHNGFTDDEIKDKVKTEVHIDPSSCLSDPSQIDKLIANVRSHYTEGKEGQGKSAFQYCGFWTNNYKSTEVQLSLGLVSEILNTIGYRLLDGEYVLVSNGVIHKKTKGELYEYIINFVSYQDVTFRAKDIVFTVDKTALKTKAQKELRGNVQMLALPAFDFKLLKDSAKEIFLHFQNSSLKITKDGKEIIDRKNSDGVIWAEQIIPHDLTQADDNAHCHFIDFIQNVAGDKNLLPFLTGIGSRLRHYNSSEGMKAIWLCDECYENGKNLGRLGKSLIGKAIGKVRKADECSGKDFNPENQFKFQNIDRSTQVYIVDDVKSNFDFRSMYNYCTEGVEFSRKHKDRIKLSLQDTPQLIITSNYPPKIEEGSSTTGRLHILPVKDFYLKYADDGGIKAYHGHVFFDDWDKEEWNKFFWFMAECAQLFLINGLTRCDMTEIRKSRLKGVCAQKFKHNELASDFVEWVYSADLPKSFTLDEIITTFKSDDEDVDKQVFAGCLKAFFDIENISFTKKRERVNGKQVMNWRVEK